MTETSFLLFAGAFLAIWSGAIVLSTMARAGKVRSEILARVLRAFPYVVGLAPALRSWYIHHDLMAAIGWVVIFWILAWVLTWSPRK